MLVKLIFDNIEPITLNHAIRYMSRGKVIMPYKSKEYKQFISDCEGIINAQYADRLRDIGERFDPLKNALSVRYVFHYKILTKQGTISKVSKDLTNIEKSLQDVIFKFTGVDDSQVTKLVSEKRQSKKCFIEAEIRMIKR